MSIEYEWRGMGEYRIASATRAIRVYKLSKKHLFRRGHESSSSGRSGRVENTIEEMRDRMSSVDPLDTRYVLAPDALNATSEELDHGNILKSRQIRNSQASSWFLWVMSYIKYLLLNILEQSNHKNVYWNYGMRILWYEHIGVNPACMNPARA